MTDQVVAELNEILEATWQRVRQFEPVRGAAAAEDIAAVRAALDRMVGERTARTVDAEVAAQVDGAMATIYARAAAVAIAGDDLANGERWLVEAGRLARDENQREVLAAARMSHERYRALAHARHLMASGSASAARRIWKQLAAEPDAIGRAAERERTAPQPLGPGDHTPTLSRINGIGAGFYGRRDEWPDGSYATTHCVSVLWVPVLPLSAWRVRDAQGGYQIFAREQLSPFARTMRWLMPSLIAAAIAVGIAVSYLNSPERLARQQFDRALAAATSGPAEPALRELDTALAVVANVDAGRAERAGVEVVRLTAGTVAPPFIADKLDAALRVVRRYQQLPDRAQHGPAQRAMLERLADWTHQLGDGLATAEPRIALLRAAVNVARVDERAALQAQIVTARVALAASKQADWPLDALALLVEPGEWNAESVARADEIVARLCDAPSLLVDAGSDLDAWSRFTSAGELRDKALRLRDEAGSGRTAAEADGVTPAQLTELERKYPGNQFVQLQIARNDAAADHTAAATARLTRLGPPGKTIRTARLLIAQLAAARGELEAADTQLSALLAGRLSRFTAASLALQEEIKAAEARVEIASKNIPFSLQRRYDAASESDRREIATQWYKDQLANDKLLAAARERYLGFSDVVPITVAAGSVKLRRAQKLSGAARDAMLQDAERAFLAIRGEAEGQPQFRLALGEIYARLGKITESEAELNAVLEHHDPALSIAVVNVYRQLGSTAGAVKVATSVYDTASSPQKEDAALVLGIMNAERGDDAGAERWFRKADQRSEEVKAALFELEARRLEREGKTGECAAKLAAAAKIFMADSGAGRASGYNNAAIDYERGFDCSGDPKLLRDAQSALENAYRNAPENPIAIGNLIYNLRSIAMLRTLSRRIDVRALRLRLDEVSDLAGVLLEGSERAALLAQLAGEPSMHRSRELLAQLEVLAPNSLRAYEAGYSDASLRRDVDAIGAVVERARHASIDTSDQAAARERMRDGADDDKRLAVAETLRARLEAVLMQPGADRLDSKTRAAGRYALASALHSLGLGKGDKAALVRVRDEVATAMRLWPALDGESLIVASLIDEAGLDADAKAWMAARRIRPSVAALDHAVAEHQPVGDKIRASKLWSQVAAHAKVSMFPGLADVRLARLLGDAALEARARVAFDDKLLRLGLELAVLLDPGDEVAKAELAYFDKR